MFTSANITGPRLSALLAAPITRKLEASEETNWDQFLAMLQSNERLLSYVSSGVEGQNVGCFVLDEKSLLELRQIGVQHFGRDAMSDWTSYYAVRTSH